MFGGSLGLLDDRVGRKVPAALKRLLGKTTLDDSNDDITLLVSSQYAGKVLSKTPGDKAGRHNYQCLFPSHVHTVCAPAHSTSSRTGTLRHLDSYSTSSIGVGVDVGLGVAATKPAVI
jgi:hypothetical protein